MGFTHGWQWFSPITHKHNGIQTVRFNFSLKELMKGLNKLCLSNVHVLVTMNTQACMGLVQSWPVVSGASSRTYNSKPMGDHSRGTHQLPHLWPLILTPYISPKPLFLPKNCHPKSCFFHTVQNFGNCSLKDPKSAGKKVPKCPLFLWFLSLKNPNFLPCMQVFEGNVAPQTRSEPGKFCILETESCNLVNTFRCKFNKGDENKISVLQAQPTQLLWKNFIGGQGWYTGYHPSGQTEKGIYSTTILYDSAPPGSLSKCQVYLKLCEQRHFKCKVQCRARWRARENFEI